MVFFFFFFFFSCNFVFFAIISFDARWLWPDANQPFEKISILGISFCSEFLQMMFTVERRVFGGSNLVKKFDTFKKSVQQDLIWFKKKLQKLSTPLSLTLTFHMILYQKKKKKKAGRLLFYKTLKSLKVFSNFIPVLNKGSKVFVNYY